MCEYTYSNGKKCRLKPLPGSKFCPLHISYEEGEKLFGEEIKEIKAKKFEERLKAGNFYFEGVYLYDVKVGDISAEKVLVFKNSRVRNLIIDGASLKGLVLVHSNIDRIIIFGSRVGTVYVKDSNVFGFNVLRVEFSGNISLRNSEIRYIMVNSTRYVKEGRERGEEEYGEKETVGLISISGVTGVRKIGINTRYPLLRDILQEHGINVSEGHMRAVKVKTLAIRNVSFDTAPRFKRGVRLAINGFSGRLIVEDMNIFGHVEITRSRITSPEFVHVTVEGNLVLRRSNILVDPAWNVTVLPNLPIELSVGGFVIVEDCSFNSLYAQETFYRLARTSWEKSGDFERADEYYYLEMVTRRRIRASMRRRGWKRVLQRLETVFEWLFADLTCKYGTDWKRPILIWLGAVNAFFPILYLLTGSVEGLSGSLGLLDYEYFSVVTATTLGYGDYHPIGVGRVIASLEALFGMFMWAVFLTVFARKYMR